MGDNPATRTPEADKDRWRTPQWLFKFLSELYGGFDVDLAAEPTNALCKEYIDLGMNSLATSWAAFGTKGFCNPPWSNPEPFVERAIYYAKSGFTSVLVLPTHRNQIWAGKCAVATEILDFRGRINFDKPDGSGSMANQYGTQVVVFRAHCLSYGGSVIHRWYETAALRRRYDALGAV